MKTMLLKTTLCTIGSAIASLAALAGPLQRADVPADPVWLAHVNWDGLRPTTIGQYIEAEMSKPEAQSKIAAFQTLVNVDLRTQLHGTTLYSTGTTPADGVLLVYADFDPDRLITLAKAAKDSQNTNYKQHVIYNWIDENKKAKHGEKPRVYAAIQGPRVIFAQREEPVTKALDVLDGATPNLASGNTFSPLGKAGDSSFLEAAARKLDFGDSDPNAAILKLSKLIVLQMAENQGKVNATLNLEANDGDVAGNIASIAQGLLALLKLQKDKPESVRFAEALSLKQEGAKVTLTLSLPGDELVQVIKADAARKAQKKTEKAEKGA